MFIEQPPITPEQLKKSAEDFKKNWKPLLEEMEEWRRQSASSPTRVW